ncbi:DNA photolyase [Erythrobacter insulae]|uniref:DNA photolyase n=1 Tax=Erythrobacter insulae TaxID=2584124 RepID=A0A547PCJ0_9SPHN|nr:FAD-binding domain-containing protein [Erythrobacter insulae]TRD11866.1 DNA photolyase [Erythrobacter insulae]
MTFTPTRAAAIAQLNQFLPRAGRHYANTRNYDDGVPDSGMRQNVSQLSPWLHAGVISEAEVINCALANHSSDASEKFVAEVFWRVYFKGYLEQRPAIWRDYCSQRSDAIAALDRNAGLKKAYTEAIEGRTGIAAFDTWARELTEHGYLHNHARMWFASIWIFTLKLDWTLGADFFVRHLMDGDAASNTLSWRWVGGLHTKGKTYQARPDNIERYTANQSGGPLTAEGLAQEAEPLQDNREYARQALDLPAPYAENTLDRPYALLLHDENASHVPLNLPSAPSLIIGAARPDARSTMAVGEPAREFAQTAVSLGVEEAARAYGCDAKFWNNEGGLETILRGANLDRIAVPYLPQGWTRDALMPELSPIIEADRLAILLDDLNRATWPLAKAGFFGVKKKIPDILDETGINGLSVAVS